MKPGAGPQLYAAALSAVRETTHLAPATYIAPDAATARTMALEQAAEVFPAAEGYTSHKATVLPVPPLWYNLTPRHKRSTRRKTEEQQP